MLALHRSYNINYSSLYRKTTYLAISWSKLPKEETTVVPYVMSLALMSQQGFAPHQFSVNFVYSPGTVMTTEVFTFFQKALVFPLELSNVRDVKLSQVNNWMPFCPLMFWSIQVIFSFVLEGEKNVWYSFLRTKDNNT